MKDKSCTAWQTILPTNLCSLAQEKETEDYTVPKYVPFQLMFLKDQCDLPKYYGEIRKIIDNRSQRQSNIVQKQKGSKNEKTSLRKLFQTRFVATPSNKQPSTAYTQYFNDRSKYDDYIKGSF